MLVPLTNVNWIHEADRIQSKLAGFGIDSFLPDEGAVQIHPLYANALGGIRVMVDSENYKEAAKLIQEEGVQVGPGDWMCPDCDSDRVEYQAYSKPFAFICLFFFGLPILWVKRKCICHDCGHVWPPKQEG